MLHVLGITTCILSVLSGFLINTIWGYIILAVSIGLLLVFISKRKYNSIPMVILFTALFTLGVVACNYYNKFNYNNKYQITGISSNKESMFTRTIYEVDDSLFFTDATISDQINNELNIYNLCWIIKLYELYNEELSIDYQNQIHNFLSKKADYIENYDLHELYYLSVISNAVNDEAFIHLLKNTVIQKYNEANKENLDDYLSYSYLFVLIIENIGQEFYYDLSSELKRIKEYIILIRTNITQLDYKIIASEIITFIDTKIDNVKSDDEKNNINTIMYDFSEMLRTTKEYSPVLISCISKLLYLADIYGLDEDIIARQVDKQVFNTDENLIYIDLQSFYRIELLKNYYNNARFPKKLRNIKFWLYDTYPPSSSIDLMYYGLMVSRSLNIKINKVKYINYLDKLCEKNLGLFDCYYLYLIYTELDKDTDKITKILADIFNNILFEDFVNMDHRTQFTMLYLDNALKLKFYVSNKNKIDTFYYKYNDPSINEVNFYYYIKSVNLLNIDYCDKASISDEINNIFSDDNLMSVYQIYRMMDLFTILDLDIPYQTIENFIDQVKTGEGAYYISPLDKSPEAITLRAFYEGLMIEDFLHDSKQ